MVWLCTHGGFSPNGHNLIPKWCPPNKQLRGVITPGLTLYGIYFEQF